MEHDTQDILTAEAIGQWKLEMNNDSYLADLENLTDFSSRMLVELSNTNIYICGITFDKNE